jgi:hypothetical protein
VNILTLYYDRQAHEFYDPLHDGRRVWGFAFPKLDKLRLRVAVTAGKATTDIDGKPLSAYRVSLADQSNVIFALKTAENVALEADGDISLGVSGFDTSDTGWQSLSAGMFSVSIVAPLTLAGGIYIPEIDLLDSTNNSWSLDSGDYPTVCDVTRRVYTGAESTPVSGASGQTWFAGTVLTGHDTVTITVTGMTTGGKVIPVITSGSFMTTITATCTTNTVTVQLGATADQPVSVAVLVISL